MLQHEFDKKNGILYLAPAGRLEKSDFAVLSSDVDPYISANGKINGILITANEFPFWKDFEAMMSHFKFIKDHHRKVERIAIVTDESLVTFFQAITKHFVKAEIKQFKMYDRDKADAWIKQGAHLAA